MTGRPRRRGPPTLTDAQMVERYLLGGSLEDVAIAANVSSSTVKDRVLKAGGRMRRQGGRPGKSNCYLIGRKQRKEDSQE